MNVQHVYPSNETICEMAEENKPLPDSIANMTSVDSHHLVMLEELDPHSKSKTYGKSLCVVSRVKVIGQNDKDIVLDQLTTDQV